MMKIWVLLLGLFSLSSYADTLLCVGEAGAGVDEGVEKMPYTRIAANIYTMTGQRYLLSNDSGNWMVKAIGDDGFQLNCDNEYVCNLPGDRVRSFTRARKTGNFTLIQSLSGQNKAVLTTLVIKGRCTKF